MLDRLLNAVCDHYQLGALHTYAPLKGGLLHTTWHLKTTQGQYVVKQLEPSCVDSQTKKNNYVVAETIAHALKQQLPIVSAYRREGTVLFEYQDDKVMVFEYVPGAVLTQANIKSQHVTAIARDLAAIHQAQIEVSNASPVEIFHPRPEAFSSAASPEVSAVLQAQQPFIYATLEAYQTHIEVLKHAGCISHRDFDPKNVLWTPEGAHVVIDWESAGWINPTKDLMVTALYWTLDETYGLNHAYFDSFIQTYLSHGGQFQHRDLLAGLYGLVGDWLAWLAFSLSRLDASPACAEKSASAALATLHALPKVVAHFPTIEAKLKQY